MTNDLRTRLKEVQKILHETETLLGQCGRGAGGLLLIEQFLSDLLQLFADPEGKAKEALEIVEEYIVDRDARGTMRTESLQTIRAAIVGLIMENEELKKKLASEIEYRRHNNY